MGPLAQPEQPIQRVEVDVLVILQVMKHCRQQSPQQVTGQLLGLDVDGTLQITHSFGYVQKNLEEDTRHQTAQQQQQSQVDGEQYQHDMMRKLREVNVDSNNVGWYQTTHLGSIFSESSIEMQFVYQSTIPHAVLLVYDPLQSRIGKAAFKALRLKKDFMTKYAETKEANATRAAFNSYPSGSMFEELPISITSPVMVESFLVDWAIADPTTTTQIEALDVENQVFMEKNVQLLIQSLTDLGEEQNKITQFERNAMGKAAGKGRNFRMQPPKQLDTMILSQQIQNYCKQINTSASDAFGKVYLLSNKPTGK